MADYGLLAGLAEGLSQGIKSYHDTKRYNNELDLKRQEAAQRQEEMGLKRRMANIQGFEAMTKLADITGKMPTQEQAAGFVDEGYGGFQAPAAPSVGAPEAGLIKPQGLVTQQAGAPQSLPSQQQPQGGLMSAIGEVAPEATRPLQPGEFVPKSARQQVATLNATEKRAGIGWSWDPDKGAVVPVRVAKSHEAQVEEEQKGLNLEKTKKELQGHQLRGTEADAIAAGKSAAISVESLNKNITASGISGPGAGLLAKAKGVFQLGSEGKTAASVDAARRDTAYQFASFLKGGGTPTDADVKQAFHMVPDITDSDEVRKSKEETIKNMVANKNRNLIQTLKESGFNIGKMQIPEEGEPVTISKGKGKNLQKGSAQAADMAVPKVGYVEAGYEFKGGNPADQKNWKKVD